MAKPAGNSVEVTIYGRTYQLRAEEDADYVVALARLVDERMAMAEAGSKTVDSSRLAVLTALNFADEYCRLKKEYEGRIKELEQERERLLALIDDALNEKEHISLPDT